MAMSKSMRSRIARVKSLARRKKIEELERQASPKLKAMPMAEEKGGAKPKGSAADSYSRKKNQPKPKGDKSQAKLDRFVDSGGYPAKGYSGKSVGKGSGSTEKSQNAQSALDEAMDELVSLTSDIPDLADTPKPAIRNDKKAASFSKAIRSANSKLHAAVKDGSRKEVYASLLRVSKLLGTYETKIKPLGRVASSKTSMAKIRTYLKRSRALVKAASSRISA